MTFDERYIPLYRRVYEFHKRHWGTKTETEIEKMALDESFYDENHPDFSVALFWAVADEVMRGIEEERGKSHDGA